MSTSSDGPADPADPADPARDAATPLGTAPLPPPLASSPTLPPVEPTSPPSTEPILQPSLTPSPDALLDRSRDGTSDGSGNAEQAEATWASSVPIRARHGDLTPRWRYVLAATWVMAFFAYAAIWQASVQIGIGTWWIGPRAQPTHTIVRVLPSLLTISIAMCAIYNVPRLVRLSGMGVLLATILAIPDLSRSVGLGAAELVIAGLLGLVTAAALSGRYRLVPDQSGADRDSSLAPSGAAHDRSSDPAHVPHNGTPDGSHNGTPDGASGSADTDAAMALFAPPDQTGS